VAVLASLPGLLAAVLGVHLPPPLSAFVAGAAILAAAFLLLWACDAAQVDVSQSLALAAVALIAVLPEYAVDMYFTWQAGRSPEGGYAQYAIANMTGANRLLIGIGWAAIVALAYARSRRGVQLERERRTEVGFLAAASLYGLVVPLKGSLAWYDGVVLIGLFVAYVIIIGRRPAEPQAAEGPAAYLEKLPTAKRRAATIGMLVFAAVVVVADAERFCEGLIATGHSLGISEFLLVQWLAPLASEAPEFLVAVMFALRGRAAVGLGALLSSKLNQWTLLVGMIPAVFAVAQGAPDPPIPMGDHQMEEVLLTAAQSVFAVVLLIGLHLSFRAGVALFILFAAQLAAPPLLGALAGRTVLGFPVDRLHTAFSVLYLGLALLLLSYHLVRWLARRRPQRTSSLTSSSTID
jgi:cation:H+ antiporter